MENPSLPTKSAPLVPGYGTKEAPLCIDQARAKIRADFLKFAHLVMSQVTLPEGHVFANSGALTLEHELTWYLQCEIKSSDAGLSIHGHLNPSDDANTSQLSIEVRYFHPELHYREGRCKPRVSRQYNDGYGVHLWVNQGRPYWGMHKSLIEGNQFCSGVASVESLAAIVIERLNVAIASRAEAPAEVC